jgi:hypothetical protein
MAVALLRSLAVAFFLGEAVRAYCQPALPEPEEQVIHYDAVDGLADPITMLQRQLTNQTTTLPFVPGFGYLPALLKVLDVPVSSQTLVFSKTSSQADLVNPRTPRAIYFNDQVSIGWVPGSPDIDVAAVDSKRGPIFYTLAQSPEGPPRFTRRADCIQCHEGRKTLDVPGLLVRSVYTMPDGTAVGQVDGFVNGHNSPLELRWGGWYVSGTHGATLHLGNTFVTRADHPELSNLAAGANVTDLRSRFDSTRYLSPHSDLVALLVLEHQVRMQNLITHASYETRLALDELAHERPLRETSPGALPAWTEQRIALAGELLLEYLLCRDEAPLNGPLAGTSEFAAEFQRCGPRATNGRSLHQLDLNTRLLRHPCSFLIYAAAFDALPREMKNYLWDRLEQILSGKDTSPTYATISLHARQDLLEILKETKPEFAAWLRVRPASSASKTGRGLVLR